MVRWSARISVRTNHPKPGSLNIFRMSLEQSLPDRILNENCLGAMALQGDEAILDVGSGFGEFTCLMAGAAARVVAIERDETIVRAAQTRTAADGQAPRVDFRIGDALALPLHEDEWGTFDVAHTRFVLESQSDPRPVVTQMVRAVRPGGRIILTDDDHEALQLWPEAPRVMELWRAYMHWFDSAGNDSIVGRKLVTILHECGAQPVRTLSWSFGTCAGEETFADAVARLRFIFESEHQGILATGRIDRAGFEAALKELQSWSRRPDATAWNVARWAEGRKPHD